MDGFGAEPRGEGDDREQQQAVVGAAALRDGNDREPVELFLARQARTGERLDDGRERVDEVARQDAREQAQRDQHEHRRERPAIGLDGVARDRRARSPEEGHAERLHEARRRERRRKGEHRAHHGHQELEQPLRQRGAQQDRLEGEPLGDEAVERRQRRDRGGADEEGESGVRHPVDQPAEMFHVALAGRGEHGSGAEEEQALEHRMVEDVE